MILAVCFTIAFLLQNKSDPVPCKIESVIIVVSLKSRDTGSIYATGNY